MSNIVAAIIAPHPPHLVYAENPPQNEPRSECGWEVLRWGYENLREDLKKLEIDAFVVMSPHWQTYIGVHYLAVEHLASKSVDPVFPNLFRYSYDLKVDVDLARALYKETREKTEIPSKLMQNPDFRVDYGTIVSCHLLNPTWDRPIVAISSERSTHFESMEVTQRRMLDLGRVTRDVIAQSGKRVALVASHSLSHRHFTTEPEVPEDMSQEHIMNHSQYLWDMRLIELMKAGRLRELYEILPDFTEQAIAETDSGALSWMLAALDFQEGLKANVYGYGSVIGTGNVVAAWFPGQGGEQ